jgi:hypothetical protein
VAFTIAGLLLDLAIHTQERRAPIGVSVHQPPWKKAIA